MGCEIDLQVILNYMNSNNISQREVARRMNISNGYLSRVLDGERAPGMKFINGMRNLGFDIKDIFKSSKKNAVNQVPVINVDQYILDYMNTMAAGYDKEYTIEEVKRIKKCIIFEKEDRSKKCIDLRGNTIEGKKEINMRTAVIAKEKFKINVTARDIQLYKKCRDLESKERRLISNLEEFEGVC